MSDGSGGSLRLLGNAEFLALAGTAFARSQAYSTIAIALALYADIFATSGTVEGLFGTAFALVQLVIVLPLGRAIDTGNAKRYLLVGLVLNVGVFVGFALVETVSHVVLMRAVQGLGASLLWITGSTVVGEISPDAERGQWLGTYNQVGAFSSLAGDLVGGILLYTSGFTLTYTVLSGVTLLAAVGVYFFLRDDPGGQADPDEATGVETLRLLLGRTAIRALVVFRLGLSFGKMAVILFLPIYARTRFGMNPILVGGILAGGKLTKSLTQGVVGSYTDSLGHKHLFVFVGALLYALGAAIIPFAEYAVDWFAPLTLALGGRSATLPPAFFPLFGAFAVCGIADSIRLPASMALFVEEGEHFDAVAGSLSLRSIAWKIGQVVGPVTVGALWDATSVFTAFFTASAFIAVAALAFFGLYTVEPAPESVPAAGD
ncbi:MFS transporter [Halosimplex salinum]|uniref:MFS transporter n=1 Tax=Halosimplex salinum TaxID=1710538 RepID=UPI000F4A86E7|nr:MFS transporter [Halosimplex salinum]